MQELSAIELNMVGGGGGDAQACADAMLTGGTSGFGYGAALGGAIGGFGGPVGIAGGVAIGGGIGWLVGAAQATHISKFCQR